MDTLFELLAQETHPAVRAVLGHFVFVFIHPYSDGNGRMGRFLMNAMFASGGTPWTIIHLENRTRYMDALEEASVQGNIQPFAAYVLAEINAEKGER
jgi:Fic family protein